MGRKVLAVFAVFPLAACASTMTVPVAVVSKSVPGGIMRGTNTVSLTEASFNVSNGTLSCGGSYSPLNSSPTISIPVICNDGRNVSTTMRRRV
jgi:hypothetical protein